MMFYMKLVCNFVYMHGTFKNNHNYIYIYINCLLIDYELKNKLKLTFKIINVKNRISHAKTTYNTHLVNKY